MSLYTDPRFLRSQQYATSANLDARKAIHARFSANPYGWFRWVFDHLELKHPGRLLELGCGAGDLWRENIPRTSPSIALTLSDLSVGMLARARESLQGRVAVQAFVVIDVQSIPYLAGQFDHVIANHMLYHVPDRPRALQEIDRILARRGCFYASTVGEGHMREFPMLLKQFDPGLVKQFEEWQIDFSLETGQEILNSWFSEVTLSRYPDELLVTEPAPLVDYALSSVRLGIPEEQQSALLQFFAGEIQRQGGAIRIRKDSGMFVCRR